MAFGIFNGIDCQVDYPEAFRLLHLASERGASRAIVNLGRMYAEGRGIQRNIAEAIRLYEAVARVEFFAALELARMYANANGVPLDPEVCGRWYSLAADWRDRVSESDISEEIAWATGVPRKQDIDEADSFLSSRKN